MREGSVGAGNLEYTSLSWTMRMVGAEVRLDGEAGRWCDGPVEGDVGRDADEGGEKDGVCAKGDEREGCEACAPSCEAGVRDMVWCNVVPRADSGFDVLGATGLAETNH